MFARVRTGAKIFKVSLGAFRSYPVLMVPLLFCWLVYAPTILFFKYFFPWENYSTTEVGSIVFLIIFAFAFILSFSCLVVLEVIQQIESGRNISLIGALWEATFKDLIKTLPITLIWSVIWFLLTVIQVILSRFREREDNAFSARNAARTLAGFGDFSLSAAFFEALRKGVRMAVFLMLPSIAWEDSNPAKAMKKGASILRNHIVQFTTGFGLSELLDTLIFLPPAILFLISSKFDIHLHDWVWYVTIVYCAFGWSFSILVEQLFTAELYLWNMLWERKCEAAKNNGKPIPKLTRVRRPSILNKIPEMNRQYS